jgi:hypothetical protein
MARLMTTDYRLPEHRELSFLEFYRFHLEYRSHPGCVYALLPAIAEAHNMDEDQRAWLVWLNGNTQNAVTSWLLLQAAPTPDRWADAVAFWNEHFTKLEWDTDRRHQKSKFGVATEQWYMEHGYEPAQGWLAAGAAGWADTWAYANSQPYMGRLSAWSMTEYARILLGHGVPDAGTWMLEDKSGSKSHRNGIATVAGYDAVYWDADTPDMLGIVSELEAYADKLLAQVDHPDAGRLTMESALCTYKSHYKPNRRYPGVYNDMMFERIRKAEARFGYQFDLLWETRRRTLPRDLRLEDMPLDPGLAPVKQNWFRETGQFPLLGSYSEVVERSEFDDKVLRGDFGIRKDRKWN